MMQRERTKKFYSSGFTLIELVVAILVFAIGIMGIMKMHQASIQSNNYSMQLSEAINIAQDRIDSLRGTSFDDPTMAIAIHNTEFIGDAELGAQVTRGITYNLSYVVSALPTNPSGRMINLTVTWQEKNLPHLLNIPVIIDDLGHKE
jgi:prepilin-type N-terminal cleavage/methylation domain-containing protein